MTEKAKFRKIARKLEKALFYLEQIPDIPHNYDSYLLRWIEQGRDMYESYRRRRDDAK